LQVLPYFREMTHQAIEPLAEMDIAAIEGADQCAFQHLPCPMRRITVSVAQSAPTFVTRGEVFWGDDRLEDAVIWHQRGTLGAPRAP
jgi:hypothetical protein